MVDPIPGWETTCAALRERLEMGRAQYGTASFRLAPDVLLKELRDELLDAINYAFMGATDVRRGEDPLEQHPAFMERVYLLIKHGPHIGDAACPRGKDECDDAVREQMVALAADTWALLRRCDVAIAAYGQRDKRRRARK